LDFPSLDLVSECVDLELAGDFGLAECMLSCDRGFVSIFISNELLDAIDLGEPLREREPCGDPVFSLCTESMLERLEPDLVGEPDGLSDLRLCNLFDSTDWFVDLDAPLMFDAGEAGSPFSSSECSFRVLLGIGTCDARLPLRLDLEETDALSDSDPKKLKNLFHPYNDEITS